MHRGVSPRSFYPASSKDELPCARKIIANLVRQAYRRPVTDEDLEPFLEAYAEGREGADFVIDNSGSLASLDARVAEVWADLSREAATLAHSLTA